MRKIVLRNDKSPSLVLDDGRLANALENIVDEAVNEAKRAVNKGARTGRFRDDGSLASVEGEAPHTESGELARSIKTRRHGNQVSMISTAEHAAVHEQGKRPFLLPALEAAIEEKAGEIASAIQVEVR